MARRALAAPEAADQRPRIVLTVEIDDGSLKSQVSVPVSASPSEKEAAVARWLEVMQFGLKQHGSDVNIAMSIPGNTADV